MPATSLTQHTYARPAAGIRSVWRLRGYVRPYLWQLALMIVAGLFASLAGIVVPLLTERVIDGPIAHGDAGALWPIGGLALVFGLVEAALVLLRRWTVANGALGLETDLRGDLYQRMQRLPTNFHDQWQSGQLVSRLVSDISSIRRFVGFGFVFLIVNSLTIITVGTVLLSIDPLLGGVVIVFGLPLGALTTRYERRYKREVRAVQDQQGEVATDVEESALGIRAIKAFGRNDLVGERFEAKAETLRRFQVALIRTLADLWALVMSQPTVVLGLLVLLGAVAVEEGTLTLGTLVAFAALYQLMVWPVESMGWLLANAQEANSAADRVFEVLDSPITITDPDPDTARASTAGWTAATSTRSGGRLVFDNVGFTYPGSDQPVLECIDLVIEPGETLALVGPTGCGKTTLTALVPRLHDVSSGRITLDGVDIRDLPLERLRSDVACAFEEPTLFSASVRENVRLGRPAATEQDVEQALRVAQARFVHDLPWGLDTRVGEQGMTLSGGQRQRLALARAVLGGPRVLVLDDPLSALDVETEGLVEAALRDVLSETTGLVVAHRPSTVLLADRVVLLDGGRIAARGDHHELLATVPAYRDILSQKSDLDDEFDNSSTTR